MPASFHMFLTVVPGVFEDWNHPRSIVHLTSKDLRTLARRASRCSSPPSAPSTRRSIRLPDGGWRMYYNNELDGQIDLVCRQSRPRELDRSRQAHRRPGRRRARRLSLARQVVADHRRLEGSCRVLIRLTAQTLDAAARTTCSRRRAAAPMTRSQGQHADVVVSGDRAWLFYFTHPGPQAERKQSDTYETRRSSIQVVELQERDGRISVRSRRAGARCAAGPVSHLPKFNHNIHYP